MRHPVDRSIPLQIRFVSPRKNTVVRFAFQTHFVIALICIRPVGYLLSGWENGTLCILVLRVNALRKVIYKIPSKSDAVVKCFWMQAFF